MNLVPLTICSERLLEAQGIEGVSTGSVQEALMDFLMERLKFYGRTVHGTCEKI